MGGTGQLALNQLLVTMDGIDNPPFWRRFWTNRLNNFLDATYVVPRRIGSMPLRRPAPKPADNQIYFIGATNVPARGARPGAPAPGPHGPPRLVPDTDEARPRGHLQPLPRQGPARPGARHRAGPRRARPDHQRLLSRNGRAGVLDGAHPRPPRRPPELHSRRHHRGDDHGRVGHCGRRRVRPRGDTRRGHPRGRARGRCPRVPEGRRVDADLDPHARRLARAPPGAGEGGALQLLEERGNGEAGVDARRDRRGAGVLRRERDRRRG